MSKDSVTRYDAFDETDMRAMEHGKFVLAADYDKLEAEKRVNDSYGDEMREKFEDAKDKIDDLQAANAALIEIIENVRHFARMNGDPNRIIAMINEALKAPAAEDT